MTQKERNISGIRDLFKYYKKNLSEYNKTTVGEHKRNRNEFFRTLIAKILLFSLYLQIGFLLLPLENILNETAILFTIAGFLNLSWKVIKKHAPKFITESLNGEIIERFQLEAINKFLYIFFLLNIVLGLPLILKGLLSTNILNTQDHE